MGSRYTIDAVIWWVVAAVHLWWGREVCILWGKGLNVGRVKVSGVMCRGNVDA